MEIGREIFIDTIQEVRQIESRYFNIVAGFAGLEKERKMRLISSSFESLNEKFESQKFGINMKQKSILRLKLARHFQRTDEVDLSMIAEAVIETPDFINDEKGSLQRLIEVHKQKSDQKIAEAAKKRLEINNNKTYNPWENMFTTKSGKYYLARLLNMPHLRRESKAMENCVGEKNFYINRMRSGAIEIFSLRKVPTIYHPNQSSQKLRGDLPVVTIEYNVKKNTIEQIKAADDMAIDDQDPFYEDLIDALKRLRKTKTNKGRLRDFTHVAEEEFEFVDVGDGNILTENGEIPYRKYDPDSGDAIFKVGELKVYPQTRRSDIAKMVSILQRRKINPSEVARNIDEVTTSTRVYVGKVIPNLIAKLPESVKYIYTAFPECIVRESVVAGGKTGTQCELEIMKQKISIDMFAKRIFQNRKFQQLEKRGKINLVRLNTSSLSDPDDQHYLIEAQDVCERAIKLGLEPCPPDVITEIIQRYKNLPETEAIKVPLKTGISESDPDFFEIDTNDDGTTLSAIFSDSIYVLPGSNILFFRVKDLQSGAGSENAV